MQMINKCERYFTPVGRILIGAFFFLAGVNKFTNIEGTAGYIASVGLPMSTALAWLAAIFLVVVAGAFIAGYRTKHAALLLALFTLFVSFVFHGPQVWGADESGMQMLMFMKNIAILGGLLFIAAHVGAPCCQTKESPAPEQQNQQPSM